MMMFLQGIVCLLIWSAAMVVAWIIMDIIDKEDKEMDLSMERIVKILDRIDSYALPGSFEEQRETEQALTKASYIINLMYNPTPWGMDYTCECGCHIYPMDIDSGNWNYCPNCGRRKSE